MPSFKPRSASTKTSTSSIGPSRRRARDPFPEKEYRVIPYRVGSYPTPPSPSVDRSTNHPGSRRRITPLTALATLMLTVAGLYWGKPVLIPLTIAILLTFLLKPIVNILHRWG